MLGTCFPCGAIARREFFVDLDALAEEAVRDGRIGLVPVLFDFYTWNGSRHRDFRTWAYDADAQLFRYEREWDEGEHLAGIVDSRHQTSLVDNVVRPVIRHLLELNAAHPGLIRAIDLANEPDNAEAVMTARDFPLARAFLERLVGVASDEIERAKKLGMSQPVAVTIG